VAAVFPLRVVVFSAAVLIGVAIAASLVAAWVWRPSAYESACHLDEVAGLRDRISTAWHCMAFEAPDEMILRQRRDALERVARTDPRGLFPVRLPRAAGRPLVLAVAVAGLRAYR